jgi:DNA adenine methylase
MHMKSFLKWAGGKYRSLDPILKTLPKANRLIEPFTGSAVIFMNADYPSYLLAEKNQDLISLFHCIRAEGASFIADCQQLFCMENNTAEQFYHFRDQFNQSRDPRKRATLFLYLNRHGYNGLCRYNQKGGFNVPFGRYEKPYFPLQEMQHFHQKSQQADIIHSDFRKTFLQANVGDIIYCDPPYAPLKQTSNFTDYTDEKFGMKEQIELAKLAIEYAGRGIPVIISNHDTEFTRYHYQQAKIHALSVRRYISRDVDQRFFVKELMAVFG